MLRLPRARTGKLPFANVGFHRALLRFLSPNARFDDTFNSMDLRLSKDFHLSERFTLEGIAEVFNLFNWNNNLSYGGTQFTATGQPVPSFGIATAAYAARQGQVGMRVDW